MRGPVGNQVIAASHLSLSWAVDELVRTLPAAQLRKLKVSAGEHLAAILTTAFLGAAPTTIDTDGGTDLQFDFTDDTTRWLQPSNVRAADFEVKSLPGDFRRFDAAINQAEAAGREPDRVFKTKVTSANHVLLHPGRGVIANAMAQLARKSSPGHSKNVFLIVHPFEHFTVECVDNVFISHLLDPLSDIDGVDTVWILWAPDTIVVYSSEYQRWADLVFGYTEEELSSSPDNELALLQQVEMDFLDRTGNSDGSPYLFSLRADSQPPRLSDT